MARGIGRRNRREDGPEEAETMQASGRLASQAKEHLRELEEGQETEVGELDRSEDLSQGFRDYAKLTLKENHSDRPIWVCPNGSILLEASSKYYLQAYDFLVAIAEPVARPELIHEYRITPNSLYAAVSVGISIADIISILNKLSKVDIPKSVHAFIVKCTKNFGRAKLVLKENRHYIESSDPQALRTLLSCDTIRNARDDLIEEISAKDQRLEGFAVAEANPESKENRQYLELVAELDDELEDDSLDNIDTTQTKKKVVNFRISQGAAQEVKRAAATELDFPLQEEYDFRHDNINESLSLALKPETKIRNYQEKSLARMFGNSRARSGIIVLPCGAGKTLTAITAATTIKRWTIVLCTNATAVIQWKTQFEQWTTLASERIAVFTSDQKTPLHPECGILITTYTMISYSGKRAADGEILIQQVKEKEWGLMILDEVHVVPAATFRKVLAVCNAHCKLGLTATLVREDDLITDLNFLIGPKLYEANWMDLTQAGHLANVQCVEVWCPMTPSFYREYLRWSSATTTAKKKDAKSRKRKKVSSSANITDDDNELVDDDDDDDTPLASALPPTLAVTATPATTRRSRTRQLLYVLNPIKFRRCEYLVDYHEKREDKVIVFSDDVFALLWYAKKLNRPAIYGATKESERQSILLQFRTNPIVNTVCLSKVGDVAIDLPEANVIIQVSSHFGSRRQEAQRLGRILRPKPNSNGSEGINAIFYTLVSQDTTEMYYSSKRQQYLIDQGYSFKVVTDLDTLPDSKLATPRAELDLLNEVLHAQWQKDEEAEERAMMKAASNDEIGANAIAGGTSRVMAMSKLSGGRGLTYLEYDATKIKFEADKSTANAPKRHKLFKSRATTKKTPTVFASD